MSSNISLEGDIPRVWASGSVVNLLVDTCLGESLGNQPQVWTERWQERPGLQGVSRPFALESCGKPGHALTGTNRDPRLFWGTVSRQEAGTCEKGIFSVWSWTIYTVRQSMAMCQDTGTGQGQLHGTWCSVVPTIWLRVVLNSGLPDFPTWAWPPLLLLPHLYK